MNKIEWSSAQRICELPDVDEAIVGFMNDSTGDNATIMVRAVMQAMSAMSAQDAKRLDWIEAYIRLYGRMPEFHPDNRDLRSAVDRAIEMNPQVLSSDAVFVDLEGRWYDEKGEPLQPALQQTKQDTQKPWEKTSWTCALATVTTEGVHCPASGRCKDCIATGAAAPQALFPDGGYTAADPQPLLESIREVKA